MSLQTTKFQSIHLQEWSSSVYVKVLTLVDKSSFYQMDMHFFLIPLIFSINDDSSTLIRSYKCIQPLRSLFSPCQFQKEPHTHDDQCAVSPAPLGSPLGLWVMYLGWGPAFKHCNKSQSRILAKLHMKAGIFKGSLKTNYDELWSNTRGYVKNNTDLDAKRKGSFANPNLLIWMDRCPFKLMDQIL